MELGGLEPPTSWVRFWAIASHAAVVAGLLWSAVCVLVGVVVGVFVPCASRRSPEHALELVEGDRVVALLPRLGRAAVLFGRGGLVVDRSVLEELGHRIGLASAGDEGERLLGLDFGEVLDGLAELLLGGHGNESGYLRGWRRPPRDRTRRRVRRPRSRPPLGRGSGRAGCASPPPHLCTLRRGRPLPLAGVRLPNRCGPAGDVA